MFPLLVSTLAGSEVTVNPHTPCDCYRSLYGFALAIPAVYNAHLRSAPQESIVEKGGRDGTQSIDQF